MGGGREDGELFVWEAHSGERTKCIMVGHPALVYAVAWSADGEVVMSGGSDGKVRGGRFVAEHACECERRIKGLFMRSGLVRDGT